MRENREIVKTLERADKTDQKAGPAGFNWTFQRLGGLDQVIFRTADDLRHLGELDPKLWVALSCPASGLEFDSRTLNLIDHDRDGRIRIPEIVESVQWTAKRLKDPASIFAMSERLELDEIDDSTPEGKRLITTGRAILDNLGKKDRTYLTQRDVSKSAAHASEQTFNGDGILPPLPALGDEMCAYIRDAMSVIGGVEDAGGQNGINLAISTAFMKTVSAWRDWRNTVDQAVRPLDDKTQAAWELLSALKEKIDDYFLRCELAAYAPETRAALNRDEQQITPNESGLLITKTLASLPLSQVEPDKALDLTSGINPAWRDKVDSFAELIAPLLQSPGVLTREDWRELQSTFEPYSQALAKKPQPPDVAVTYAPTTTIDKLGDKRIDELAESDLPEEFAKLAKYDAGDPAAAADIAEVERLVLFHKHLYRLLINFVSFEEFFDMQRKAAFQAGTLYIDGRSCRLCMPAEKVEEHSALAGSSQLYLLYCACSRGATQGSSEPAEKMNIVAAVSAGDSDLLQQGRNGVFIDNKGEDWDATVIKIINNPISIWQAVWSPYKRIGNLITDQLSKYASDKQAALLATAGQKIGEITTAATTPAATTAPRFDIARNVGMLAAVGIALGALGTAVGSIARALFAMSWWQFPILIAGLFAFISGPSMIIAWLKLRQRTLGPLLEASGWAINGRAVINYAVACRLTATAVLPENVKRSRTMYDRKKPSKYRWLVLLAGIAVGALLWYGLRSCRPYARENRPAGAVISPIRPESITTSGGTASEAAAAAVQSRGNETQPPPTPGGPREELRNLVDSLQRLGTAAPAAPAAPATPATPASPAPAAATASTAEAAAAAVAAAAAAAPAPATAETAAPAAQPAATPAPAPAPAAAPAPAPAATAPAETPPAAASAAAAPAS